MYLYSKGTPPNNIPLILTPLSAIDEQDDKLTKLEAETSHQISTTEEGPYMIPDKGNDEGSKSNLNPLHPHDCYDKLPPLQKVCM